MTLPSEQELRCAEAVCSCLRERTGRPWKVAEWNDGFENSAPSFDLRLSDGLESLLVEITRLSDGPAFSRHDENLQRLFRALSPDPERSYCVFLPPPHLLRLDPRQVRQLRRAIRRAAPGLRVGDKAHVAVPRRGILKFMRECAPGYLACHHDVTWPLSEFSSEVSGVYFLQDDWRHDHQFATAERQSEFQRVLLRACSQSR